MKLMVIANRNHHRPKGRWRDGVVGNASQTVEIRKLIMPIIIWTRRPSGNRLSNNSVMPINIPNNGVTLTTQALTPAGRRNQSA